MDYSYFSAQTQPYSFTAFPPTPAHSYEMHDDQTNDAPDVYQNPNGFAGYEAYQYPSNGFIPSQQPTQHQQSAPAANHRPSVTTLTPVEPSNPNGVSINGDYDLNDQNGHRSSSEDKEILTPAQSRRKAQNRAAQRAFRERKERHVKDLESKLNSLSAHSSTLLTDNERLKRELQRLATQNEILRATTNQPNSVPQPPSPVHGPQTYSPTDFMKAVSVDTKYPISYEDFGGAEGDRLLAAGATWDYIQNHEKFKKGMVAVEDVCARLKGRSTCDGRGPAFRESEILRAIEESTTSGGDELI